MRAASRSVTEKARWKRGWALFCMGFNRLIRGHYLSIGFGELPFVGKMGGLFDTVKPGSDKTGVR